MQMLVAQVTQWRDTLSMNYVGHVGSDYHYWPTGKTSSWSKAQYSLLKARWIGVVKPGQLSDMNLQLGEPTRSAHRL